VTSWPGTADLLPAIVQDSASGRVLMLAWMNAAAYRRTAETGRVTFWSRSRDELWEKGETSGNTLELVALSWDCDSDALLVTVRPRGPVCHTGSATCFDEDLLGPGFQALDGLWAVIDDRARTRPAGSYTTFLLEAGASGSARKVAEEAIEVLVAAMDHQHGEADDQRVAEEVADLLYHTLVVLAERNVDPRLVLDVLASRRR
jgi:phosphoribosyl-AMP cyclohydrolase / phosphoribosyl-ATP pyrophosphohydrolase